MNYKLYKEVNEDYTALQQVLYNRGIPIDKQEDWLSAGWESINDWKSLFWRKSENYSALGLLDQTFEWIDLSKQILVLVDSDVDGMTSAAIFINYFHEVFPEKQFSYIMHEGKQHGLKDVIDKILEIKPNLVVCPDAASNDKEEHKKLNDAGIKCLTLDHHNVEDSEYVLKDSDDTVIFNVQTSDYLNKSLTGAGVTWQYCRAYDSAAKLDLANKYLDLAAIGDCGDMSDLREMEIRALMNLGFN